ncbi:MAG: hypothetical protein ACRDM7_04640, partial [Thermoleophilaceae bacterium]
HRRSPRPPMRRLPGFELDRVLAHGATTDEPELARRAAKLSTAGSRRKLAKAIERLLKEVERPQRPRCYAPARLNRAEVFRARADLAELARLLRSEPCNPVAAATASWLLRHPDSPLYEPCSPGTLASVARRATNSR